jgi:hypothetical protein
MEPPLDASVPFEPRSDSEPSEASVAIMKRFEEGLSDQEMVVCVHK